MYRQLLRPSMARALVQPAATLSGRQYLPSAALSFATAQKRTPSHVASAKYLRQSGSDRVQAPGSWRCMSKMPDAAAAADLSQGSEIDSKYAAAQTSTSDNGTGKSDVIDKLLRLLRLQPLEDGDRPKILCEFVTQAAFNFMSCGAVAMAKMYAGSDAALTMGLIMGAHLVLLPVMIFTAGPISGAHFNPMVTSVFMMARMQSVSSGVCYIVAQCLGGIFGAAGAFYSLPASMQTVGFAGVQGVPMDRTVAQAFLGEVYASFFFIFVLMGMVIDKRGWGKYGPFAVPLAICLDMWILGPVSSMCINPARALGPAVITGFWENHWLWWTAPFVGGLTAGKLYTKFWMPKDQLPAAAQKALKRK